MGKTTNLGLHTTATNETSKTFLEYRTELSGTGADSNMNIIDKAYGDMDDKIDAVNDTLDAKIDANKQDETTKFSTLNSTVSGIQSGLSQEVAARTSEDQLLNTRIDELVAPSGEAPSAAEVQDARVGVDSTTYASLGAAIRGQVGNLKSDIDYVQDTLFTEEVLSLSLGQGNIDSTTGENTTRHGTERVRCSLFQIDSEHPLYINVPSGFQVTIYEYYQAGEFRYYNNQWLSGNVKYKASYNYIRLVFSKTDLSTVEPSDLTGLEVYQFSNDKLYAAMELESIRINPFFTAGKAITESGVISDNANRIATLGYIDVSGFGSGLTQISYTAEDGYRLYAAFYSSNSASSFVSATGWRTGKGTAVASAKYMRICYATVDDATPMTVEDSIHITLGELTPIQNALQNIGYIENLLSAENLYNASTNVPNMRIQVGTGVAVSATNQDITDYIPVIPGAVVNCNFYLDSYSYGHAFYDINLAYLSSVNGRDGMKMVVPPGAAYVRYTLQKTDVASGNVEIYLSSNAITPAKGFVAEKTKWLALGDSIVYGVQSTGPNAKIDGNGVGGWATRLARSMNYDLTNQGVRGMGYVAVGSNGISWNDTLDAVDSLTGPYNLITIQLGINDYATDGVTLEGIQAALQTGIQRITAKFPEANLIVFTPLNSCREGTSEDNWAYGTAHHDGITLKVLADALTETCAVNGVKCINLSTGFVLNRYNIQTLLPDNTHPSDYCHTLLAKGMAQYLMY